MIEIELPEEVKQIVEGSIFDMDEIDDDKLAKFLFYAPELVKVYGLAMADLKRQKREIEKKIWHKENELQMLVSEVLLDLDQSAYRNEALRSARMDAEPGVIKLRLEVRELEESILDIESDIDELSEYYWSFRSLRESLSDISKGRVADKRL